ncbi:hypothetical protein [Gracilibacillus thailandensis]|nr:hypothetical protein [Gracilibacillus thailandensis]
MAKLSKQLDAIDKQADQMSKLENITVNVTGDKSATRQLDNVKDKADSIPSLKVTHVFVNGFK